MAVPMLYVGQLIEAYLRLYSEGSFVHAIYSINAADYNVDPIAFLSWVSVLRESRLVLSPVGNDAINLLFEYPRVIELSELQSFHSEPLVVDRPILIKEASPHAAVILLAAVDTLAEQPNYDVIEKWCNGRYRFFPVLNYRGKITTTCNAVRAFGRLLWVSIRFDGVDVSMANVDEVASGVIPEMLHSIRNLKFNIYKIVLESSQNK
jgi:hypothetical protein